MKDHNEYKEKLSALLDGELNEQERGEVLAHLDTCAECRTYFAELNALHGALGDLESVEPPEDFAAGVLARLHGENAPKTVKKRGPWRTWGTLAACAAVVVLAAATVPNMFRMGAKPADSATPAAANTTAEAPESVMMGTAAAGDEGGTEESFDGSVGATLYAVPFDADPSAKPAEAETPTETEAAEADMAAGATNGAIAAEPTEPMTMTTARMYGENVLTLSGEGAEDWLKEHDAVWDETNGYYLVSVEEINELPDSLTLEGVAEPVDDMVPVVAVETEAAP